ncbi:hypothetical protein MMC30_005132 [Trapelia coarctata]|nr:hypothetical protein [Trapelia coarctata]
MRLSVICDCVDAAAAKQIVQPVQCFPKLAGCAIRLGQSPAVDLRQLAEDTVLKLTHHMPVARSKPFRFLHLPRESQRRILWYTDLASVCALEWHNTYRVRPVRRIKQLGELKEGYCMRCTDAGESFCCAVNHAAYSSAPCDCWRFPLSFFLVSKEFNKEATELFFSVNKFVVLDQSSSEDSCVPINLFQLLPFGALRHLRWIRVVCSAFGWDLSQEAGEELAIWRKMAQYIARYLDTSKLTVELICDCHSDDMEPKQIWNRLQDMVGVFRFKNPPKDSLLYLHRVSHQIYAKTLEKQVMGPDYNARARGKHTDRDYSLTEVLVKRGPVYGPDGSIIHRWD